MMQLQWYPGHMTKARRDMERDIKLIDLVIELLDARIPLSSRNPDIDTLAKNKYRLILLNKADLADKKTTDAWVDYFKEAGIVALPVDARNRNVQKLIEKTVLEVCKAKFERDRKRGILNRPVRGMVCGIPNVGKSTFINSFAGKSTLKTGNKPGVTKQNQWIRLNKTLELLDTPGILWPKFEDPKTGLNLAFIGSINDNILDIRELSFELLKYLSQYYPEAISSRYEIEIKEDAMEMLTDLALKRHALKKGGEADTEKASRILIDDYRAGKLGKISLERPMENE